MSIQKIYSVKDLKAKQFSPPFFLKTDGLAHRAFSETIEKGNNDWSKYPEDFSLHYLGEFNPETGEMMPVPPESIANATEFVKVQND